MGLCSAGDGESDATTRTVAAIRLTEIESLEVPASEPISGRTRPIEGKRAPFLYVGP